MNYISKRSKQDARRGLMHFLLLLARAGHGYQGPVSQEYQRDCRKHQQKPGKFLAPEVAEFLAGRRVRSSEVAVVL